MQLYTKALQPVLGYSRRAIADYNMLDQDDRVAVGVSGGKDSLVLLAALCRMREFLPVRYTVTAITIDPCFGGRETDFSPVQELCGELGASYAIRRTDLGNIIFNTRKEKNPCSLCARMRRAMLHDLALQNGCNKLALGHHRDDAVETLMMNLFREGRIGCFRPVTWLSRKELTVIRPLLLTPEQEVIRAARRMELQTVKSECPVDGATARTGMKNFLREMESGEFKNLRKMLFGALRKSGINGW
ncbi:MAG: tRNA 2-thiocytidine biosynthesis TtcA family protein [Oscillospiraceae bacterium]|nr:tRNA 2-thiocytidine biosynthesis TtcA family protein [Oscillospiraceae bacterium]